MNRDIFTEWLNQFAGSSICDVNCGQFPLYKIVIFLFFCQKYHILSTFLRGHLLENFFEQSKYRIAILPSYETESTEIEMAQQPDIYEFLDYREFLNAYYQFRKEESDHFSLRSFGRMVDIDASYLAKIFNASRHIAPRSVTIVAAYLKLDEQQNSYFENLILFNKARSEEVKREQFQKLLRLRKQFTKKLDEFQFSFYQKWYHVAMRNLLEFYPFFKGDSVENLALQFSPPITSKQAQESLDLLEKLNLIRLDDTNRFVLTDTAISTGDSWSSLAVNDFQRETIRLCSDAIQTHPREERDISTVTMNITEREFQLIRSMIKEFRTTVISMANGVETPDRVFQLNMQMIPLSKKSTNGGKQ